MTSLKSPGLLAVTLFAATAAWAVPASTNIAACVNSSTGAVRIVSSTSLCVAGETGITWALAGATGPQGPAGPAGAQGPAGPAGAQGPAGVAGAQGPAGPTGATGLTGPAGATGAQGPIGNTGPAGATGAQGPIGLTGATGAQGPAGVAGPPGATGPAGATGAQGPQGVAGATGPAGANGTNGTNGATGPQGPAGPTGFLYMMSLDNGTTIGPYFAAPNETVSMTSGNLNYDAGGYLNAVIVPDACTVNYIKVGTYNYYDNGADTTTFTVLHNGTATSMSCVTATPSGGKATCNDTTHTFTVAAGDTLSIEIQQTNDTPYVMYSSALACQ